VVVAAGAVNWYFRPQEQTSVQPLATAVPVASAPTQTPDTMQPVNTPAQTDVSAPTATPDPWAQYFSTDGTVTQTDTDYHSENVSIAVEKVQENDVTYFVADIRLRSMDCLRTTLANDTFGRNIRETTSAMAVRSNALLAISGDYYGYRDTGIVIRNGTLYRDDPQQDILAFFPDGTMKTYHPDEISGIQLVEMGATQAFAFGPSLLENGQALDYYDNSDVNPRNPRSAIGMIEPYHFLFIVVDGRAEGYSVGMKLSELAQVFASRGCISAYNLDGGGTATMFFNGQRINKPLGGEDERGLSDIIYIGELLQ